MPNIRKESESLRIVIVGGGFAGVTLAEHLNRRVGRDIEVVVISSENHMVFTPMLAEVAGRSLSGLDVVVPGRQIAPRATWLTATVSGVDLKKNEVEYIAPGRENCDAFLCSPGSRLWLRRSTSISFPAWQPMLTRSGQSATA